MTTVHSPEARGSGQALLGRGSVYLVGTACQVAGSFLALPLLTRILDAEAFGLVALAVVVTQILRVLAEGGLSTVVTLDFFAEDGPARARRLAGVAVVLSVLITGVAHLTGPIWVQLLAGVSYGGALVIAVWSAPVLVALVAGQAVLRAEGRAGSFVASAAVASVGAQACGLGATLVLGPTAESYLLGVLLGYAVGAAIACWSARITFDAHQHRRELRPALGLAWPSVPHGLALYLLQAGDRIVVERVDGLAAVGRYQTAYLVGAAIISVLSAVNNAWAPLIYGARPEQRNQTLIETTGVLLRLSSVAVAGVALGAPFALHLAAPSSYQPDDLVPVTAVVALSAVPFCLYLANVHVIFVSRKTRVLAVVTPLTAAANIGLNLVFVPAFGLVGAAVATVMAYGLQALIVRWASDDRSSVVAPSSACLSALIALTGVAAGLLLPTVEWGLAVRAVLGAVALGVFASTVRQELAQ